MEAWTLSDFREWMQKFHEGLLNEYDGPPSEFMDLDEWMEEFHPEIIEDFDDWLVLEEEGRDHYECLEE